MNRTLQRQKCNIEHNSIQSMEAAEVFHKEYYEKKLNLLYEEYKKLSTAPIHTKEGEAMPFTHGVFLSAGNETAKCLVFFGSGSSGEGAWQDATQRLTKYLEEYPREVQFLKFDIPYAIEHVLLEDLNDRLEKTKRSFWRKGIAFDPLFQTAFLEQELNANKLVLYDKNGISVQNINGYFLSQNRKQIFYLPDFVYTFQCISVICDEKDNTHALYDHGYNYGRRKLTCVDGPLAAEVLTTAGEKLSGMVGADGKYQYGCLAVAHEKIPTYNILRHLSATWALLMEYERGKSKEILKAIDRAIDYVMQTALEVREDKAFVIERAADEVKLGGCALFAIVLEVYIRLTGKEELISLASRVGNGILFFADKKSGDFWHVLTFPAFTYKEKMRVPSYHSQGAYALAVLYGLTGDERYLEGAKSTADLLIRLNYTQYGDAWVSYAMNAITKHCPTEKYFSFAMKNMTSNLSRIYKQETSFYIFLELLLESFEIYDRMKEDFSSAFVLRTVDERWFLMAIYYRAQHQLNGYMYPEYMMYFENPMPYLYSFVVRHDGFRMRIDDIGHFMSGYFHFWKNFDRLEKHRIRLGITPADYMQLQERYLHETWFSQARREEVTLAQKTDEGGINHEQG